MTDYAVYPVTNRRDMAQAEQLLAQEGLRLDGSLDYTCAAFDPEGKVIATGSCSGSTLRCLAVSKAHRGEGLLNEVLSHLVQVQFQRGNLHLFLYTKPQAAEFFRDLGFYEIARVSDTLVFMENRRDGFGSYIRRLQQSGGSGPAAALVMNANPFTLGHLYLVEQAAAQWDTVHLFAVSEDSSLVPYAVRRQLICQGTAHLKNVQIHDTGSYMISRAVFPSYFLKDSAAANAAQAQLDAALFIRIAKALNISARYVGQEPTSRVTGIYNRVLQEALPKAGIACVELPRLEACGSPISASVVRQRLKAGRYDGLEQLLPPASLAFFRSEAAKPVLERLRAADDVVHC